ncbi:uncharacterized protein [Venturia canescens]|uniref:uncharacterized protein isoform X1 n=1 Tax=Venturia canescens TaxID=32260 RepID=UPI001C9BF9FA|nr:uncharacterized protein LOC122413177 isoform X1 [Venturia canescens]XP_043279286.1 uncharacterized protein LOC122413177 isoform X1 [Venturia canescens]
MEWDQETCIKLIGEYRNREVLWNPRNLFHYNKIRKEDAWREVSEKFGNDINEVKKKIESLKGSYRREKTRMKKSVGTGKGRNEVYMSKWFGFEHLHFLEDKDEVRKTLSNVPTPFNEEEDSSNESRNETFREETEIGQNQYFEEVLDEHTLGNENEMSDKEDKKEFKSPKKLAIKRKKNEEDPRIAKAFGYLEEATVAAKQKKDQYSLFGEYIADKLRTFDARSRAVAQHRISNVVFELEMNAFQHPETPLVQSSFPIHSSQRNAYQSVAPHNQSQAQFGYSDQFYRAPMSTNYNQPSLHLSNFQQETLRPLTPQTFDTDSSRSSTPMSQLNSPYPSPQKNNSPSLCNYFQQLSDSSNDTQ